MYLECVLLMVLVYIFTASTNLDLQVYIGFVCLVIVLSIFLLLSYFVSIKAVYGAIIAIQIVSMFNLYLLKHNVMQNSKDIELDVVQTFGVVQPMFTHLLCQMHLFQGHKLKLSMSFIILLYFGITYRLIGLDFFTRSIGTTFRIIFSEFITFGVSAYYIKKLSNLDRLRI